MAHPRKPRVHDSTNEAVPGGWSDKDASDNPIDPRVFGLAKAAYGVGETLDFAQYRSHFALRSGQPR